MTAISLALAILLPQGAFAQESEELDEVDMIVGSMMTVRDAVANGDSIAIAGEMERLASTDIKINDEIRPEDYAGSSESLFLETWKDAIHGSKLTRGRGVDRDGLKVTTRRFNVAKGSSVKFTVKCSSRLSVAVVPEAGGLVTMRLHAYNRHGFDRHFDDTEKFHQGKSYRKKKISVPDMPTKVEIEVINRSPKNISYTLITK